MKLLSLFFCFAPIIIIIGFVLIVISLVKIKKGELEKSTKLIKIGYFFGGGYVIFLAGIIFPFEIINAVYKNTSTSALMISVIFVFWLIRTVIIHFNNRKIIFKNNEKDIYVRDIEVEYSPAVLSYLMNNKIEVKKDLPATLLNLCANNVIKIEKDENGKINIIDLKNEKQIEKLSEDEKYAYKMCTTQITKRKISAWKKKIQEEYQNYNFSKSQKNNFFEYVLSLLIILAIIIFIIFIVKLPGMENMNEILAYIFLITLIATFESFPFVVIEKMLKKKQFVDTYTRKGAIEYNRWKKFEKFIEEYTYIKEKNFENIIILGKYLSYSIALGINKKCDSEIYNEINTSYSFDFDNISKIFEEEK